MVLTYALIILGVLSFIIGSIVQLRPEDAKRRTVTIYAIIGAAISAIGLYLNL